jgi:hypothetical protein
MKLGDRYALVEIRTGALMLDLVSGAIVELNESGKAIWQRALDGASEAKIAADLAARHALDLDTAARHVREALGAPFDGFPEAPPSDFHYERRGNQYVFTFRGDDAFLVDEGGQTVTLIAAPTSVSLSYLLHAIAPKVIALRGQSVLHASAVALGGRIFAFAGLSGAGKTSTARAFARSGLPLVSEDKLIIRTGETGTLVAASGEKTVAEWVAATARTLASAKRATCADLDRAIDGETMPLAEIGFLDVRRRTRGSFAARALSETETAAAAFRNAFYGSDANADWIRHLRTAASIGRTVSGFDLSLPDGIDRLDEAARWLMQAGSLQT